MQWNRLKISTAPTESCILLEEAKLALRVTAPDEDALIMGFVASAEARIDGPDGIGWALMTQTWTLTLDDFETVIKLPLPGVTAIDSVTYVDTAGATQTVAAASYRLDTGGYPARLTEAYNTTWPTVRAITGAVVITFTAGATNPGDVPEDLRQAVLLMLGHWFSERKATGSANLATIPLGVEHILNNRRRAFIAA